jgi:hypothetical protein
VGPGDIPERAWFLRCVLACRLGRPRLTASMLNPSARMKKDVPSFVDRHPGVMLPSATGARRADVRGRGRRSGGFHGGQSGGGLVGQRVAADPAFPHPESRLRGRRTCPSRRGIGRTSSGGKSVGVDVAPPEPGPGATAARPGSGRGRPPHRGVPDRCPREMPRDTIYEGLNSNSAGLYSATATLTRHAGFSNSPGLAPTGASSSKVPARRRTQSAAGRAQASA